MNQYAKVSHVGLDHHKSFGSLTARDAQNQVLFRERLEYKDREKLRQRLVRFPAGTPAIVEGTFAWGWISDEVAAAKLQPHLASSRKVAAWREARGLAKSNRIDADLLSELWPQQPRWWEVWLAPREVRELRELLRYRMGMVHTQTTLKNRIHATLHRHGVQHEYSDLFGAAGHRYLKSVVDSPEASVLPANTRMTLGGLLSLLDEVRKEIAKATRVVRKLAIADRRIRIWHSLPGIGWILAFTIQAETGDAFRFQNGKKYRRYCTLAPLADDSGEDDGSAATGRHVGYKGRLVLKWAWIEGSHGGVRKDPRLRAFFDRRTENGTRNRSRGYIAVAGKMADIGLACEKKDMMYSLEPPPRPGSKPAEPLGRIKEFLSEKKTEKKNVKRKRSSSSGHGPA